MLPLPRNPAGAVPLIIRLEREHKLASRYETVVLPEADPITLRYVERLVKFLLWSRGGWKLRLGGPKPVGKAIRRAYSPHGARKFDADMMTVAYARAFEAVVTTAGKVPAAKESRWRRAGICKAAGSVLTWARAIINFPP